MRHVMLSKMKNLKVLRKIKRQSKQCLLDDRRTQLGEVLLSSILLLFNLPVLSAGADFLVMKMISMQIRHSSLINAKTHYRDAALWLRMLLCLFQRTCSTH